MRITGKSSYLHDYSNLVSMIDSDNFRIICQVLQFQFWTVGSQAYSWSTRFAARCYTAWRHVKRCSQRCGAETIGLNNPKKKVLLCLAIKHRGFAMKKLGVKIGGFCLTMQNRGLACIAYKHQHGANNMKYVEVAFNFRPTVVDRTRQMYTVDIKKQ